jgi:hypothetical protein
VSDADSVPLDPIGDDGTFCRAEEIGYCPQCDRPPADIHCTSPACAWALCDHCWVWIDTSGRTRPAPEERERPNRLYPGYEDPS